MAGLQTRRAIDLATPLGTDVLLFRSMTVIEELGRPFELRLHALSSDDGITLEDLLGKNVTVRLELPDGASRYFNGFVTSFCQAGRYSNYAAYRVTLRPWLW